MVNVNKYLLNRWMHEFGFSGAMDSLFEARFWILGRQTLERALGFEEEELLNCSISSGSSAYVQNSNYSKTTKRK